MAQQTELAVRPRELTGKSIKRLRKDGYIPANIFGHGEEPQAIQVAANDFEQLRRGHNATSVLALKMEKGRPQSALIRHVQRDPVSGKVLHIDFFRVGLRDRITAKVPLHFEGTAPGVKIEGGVLLHLVEALEVECAAGDIEKFLTVDISRLEKIDDTIHAKDIPLPRNYTLVVDPEEPVVKVTAPRAEKAEVAAPAEEAAPAPAAEPSTSTGD